MSLGYSGSAVCSARIRWRIFALSCDISFAFLCVMVASTLGVGVLTGLITLGVGLLTGFATLGVVASSLGTCLGGGVFACGAWLSSSSNFCSASNSIMPFVFPYLSGRVQGR